MAVRPDTPNPKPRRFYTSAAIAERDGAFAVTLDGRIAKSPAGARLIVPTRALATAVAAEWAAQADAIDVAAMPLTRLAFTALDRVPGADEALAQTLVHFAQADVLCYFAETPQDLLARQSELWTPWLDWAAEALGLYFVRAVGIVHAPQPPDTLSRVASWARGKDGFNLTGLAFAAGLFHSAILALAVQHKKLSGSRALDLSRLDQAYQEDRWGVDAESAARTEAQRRDAQAVQAWFEAL